MDGGYYVKKKLHNHYMWYQSTLDFNGVNRCQQTMNV